MKTFNTEAICIPGLHYMVDLTSRLARIRQMVDEGKYFTINRARQYGKTTLLHALEENLSDRYLVVSLDFQVLDTDKFKNADTFSRAFASRFLTAIHLDLCKKAERDSIPLGTALEKLERASQNTGVPFELMELFDCLSAVCTYADCGIVLIIDEVDSASNNQVFLDFLAQLRSYYINRMKVPTFQSVILASVYDIKHLRSKVRPDEEHRVNSPWNIAADFDIDMSFHPAEIAGMLEDYSTEHAFRMDTVQIARLVYDYTHGYPYLVSRICKIIDERLLGTSPFEKPTDAWSSRGVEASAGILVHEKNTLFESLAAKLINVKSLRDMVCRILFNGEEVPFTALDPDIEQASMFGFIRNDHGKAVIANRIFETVLYSLLLTTEEDQKTEIWKAGADSKPLFIKDGHLDMDLILERFAVTFDDLYGDRNARFIEDDGRRYFLLYLKPIINGTGNYYIESRTRNNERTDVIIDYLGEQYVIELKIWRGNSYNERGEKQLYDYLDYYHLKKGWMLSFCFNKNKKTGIHTVRFGGRELVEVIV